MKTMALIVVSLLIGWLVVPALARVVTWQMLLGFGAGWLVGGTIVFACVLRDWEPPRW